MNILLLPAASIAFVDMPKYPPESLYDDWVEVDEQDDTDSSTIQWVVDTESSEDEGNSSKDEGNSSKDEDNSSEDDDESSERELDNLSTFSYSCQYFAEYTLTQ
jgi:hypothetical protein